MAIITGRYQVRLAVGLEEPIGATTQRGIGLPPEHPTLPSLNREGNMFYIIIILAAIFTMPAKADETLKWRQVQHVASNQTQQVGDANTSCRC